MRQKQSKLQRGKLVFLQCKLWICRILEGQGWDRKAIAHPSATRQMFVRVSGAVRKDMRVPNDSQHFRLREHQSIGVRSFNNG